MPYLKNAYNDALLALGGALTDDPLYVDRIDESFEEALGDLPFVEDAGLRLDAFELVVWGTFPLVVADQGKQAEALAYVNAEQYTFKVGGGRAIDETAKTTPSTSGVILVDEPE